MKKKVFIRAEAGTEIGLGHVMRCIALAEVLKADFQISFITDNKDRKVIDLIKPFSDEIIFIEPVGLNEEWKELKKHISENDILVIDGYDLKSEYQKKIKEEVKCKLVAIDDLHAWHQYADVVINHAVGGIEHLYSNENYTKIYCGLNYALLRNEFKNFESEISEKKNGTVLVAMGGADPMNFTEKVVNKLLLFNDIQTIKILIGKLNPHRSKLLELVKLAEKNKKQLILTDHIDAGSLAKEYYICEFCILSASGMSIEALAVGANLGVIKTADNQNDFYEYIKANELAADCSSLLGSEINDEKQSLKDIFGDHKKKKIFIGKNSDESIRKIFLSLN